MNYQEPGNNTAESLEGAAAATQQSVNQATGALSKAVQDAASGDFTGISEIGLDLLPKALLVVIGVIVSYFVASFLARIISTPVRRRVDETLGRFVAKVVFYGVMLCALLGIAGSVGISVTSFAAVIGAVGFAVGLAFQGTLSNFAAGVLLLVFRPFKVGDMVSAAGVTARVNEIDLFSTTFDTPDNRRIIVPNSAIASGTIENISFHKERRVEVLVGTDYSADLAHTRSVLSIAAESLSEFLVEGEDRGYSVQLAGLGDSAVNWKVRFWTKADDFWTVNELLTSEIKNRLDSAGIGIPFPQMDVHLDSPQTQAGSVQTPSDTNPQMAETTEFEGKIRPRHR